MREIKFRAFWVEDKSMIYEIEKLNTCISEEDRILMQYTGIKDKNGVEIYEGDILRGISSSFSGVIGEVKLCEYPDNEEYVHSMHYGWNVNGIPLVDLISDGCEVIGNIHENPELLTGQ